MTATEYARQLEAAAWVSVAAMLQVQREINERWAQ